MMRKPSCLISCSHWLPDGSLSVLVGRHGGMNPAGRVVPANDFSIAWSARERNLTLWPSTPALGRGRVQRAALRGASAVWDDDDFGIMRGEAHLRYANRVTFQFEKCKPALARRVGHDARQTSRARRGKSRPAVDRVAPHCFVNIN